MSKRSSSRFERLFLEGENETPRDFEDMPLELADNESFQPANSHPPQTLAADIDYLALLKPVLEPEKISPSHVDNAFRAALAAWAKQNDDIPDSIANDAAITDVLHLPSFLYTTRSLALRRVLRKEYSPALKGARLSSIGERIEDYFPEPPEPDRAMAIQGPWDELPVSDISECLQCKGKNSKCVSCAGSNRCRVRYELQNSFAPEIFTSYLRSSFCPRELVAQPFGERVMELPIFHARNEIVIKPGDLERRFGPVAERLMPLIPLAGREVYQRLGKLEASGYELWRIELEVVRVPIYRIKYMIGGEHGHAYLYGIDNLIHCPSVPVGAFSSFVHFMASQVRKAFASNAPSRGIDAALHLCRQLAQLDGVGDEHEWQQIVESLGHVSPALWCQQANLGELYEAITRGGVERQCIAALKCVAAADGTIRPDEQNFIANVAFHLGVK